MTATLGLVAVQSDEYAVARERFAAAIRVFDELAEVETDAWATVAHIGLGVTARKETQWGEAAAYYAESLVRCRQAGELGNVPTCLEGLAAVAAAQTGFERAARLLGAAKAAHEVGRLSPIAPLFEQLYQGTATVVVQALGEAAFAAAWEAGRALSLGQAIDEALAMAETGAP